MIAILLKNFPDYGVEIEKLEKKIEECIKGDLFFVNRGVNLDLKFAYLFYENEEGKCKRTRVYGLELKGIQRKINIRKIYEEQLLELKFRNYHRNEEHFQGDSIKFLPEEKINQIIKKTEDFFNNFCNCNINVIMELNVNSIKRKIDRSNLEMSEIANKLSISSEKFEQVFEGKYNLTFSEIAKLLLFIDEDENPMAKIFLLVENEDIEIHKNIERIIEKNFEREFEKLKLFEKNEEIENEIKNSKIVYSKNKPIEILINEIVDGDEKPEMKAFMKLYEEILGCWELKHLE